MIFTSPPPENHFHPAGSALHRASRFSRVRHAHAHTHARKHARTHARTHATHATCRTPSTLHPRQPWPPPARSILPVWPQVGEQEPLLWLSFAAELRASCCYTVPHYPALPRSLREQLKAAVQRGAAVAFVPRPPTAPPQLPAPPQPSPEPPKAPAGSSAAAKSTGSGRPTRNGRV